MEFHPKFFNYDGTCSKIIQFERESVGIGDVTVVMLFGPWSEKSACEDEEGKGRWGSVFKNKFERV